MNSEAWFLHKTLSGDSSAKVTFYTRDKGIITCLFKGARKSKKQGLLQPFIPLWLVFDTKKHWHYLTSLESLNAALMLKNDALFAALYVNELIYYTLEPLGVYPSLYERYQYTLQGLSIAPDRLAIEALLRAFEWTLLDACGLLFSFTDDVYGHTIKAQDNYQLIAGRGFVKSDHGVLGQDILSMAFGEFKDVNRLKSAKKIMRQAIDHILGGRELTSRQLFQKPNALLK